MAGVLYDGWPLVYQPLSPAALHLLTLLAEHPPEFPAYLALPGVAPDWLPGAAQVLIEPAAHTPTARLNWEQRYLPRQAAALEGALVHQAGGYPALFNRTGGLLSPAEPPQPSRSSGLSPRLREALGQGGQSRLRGVLWPEDIDYLPPVYRQIPQFRLPAGLPPGFDPQDQPGDDPLAGLSLPETFVLYHGPQSAPALRTLLEAWSWAAGAIGLYYPLLIAGLEPTGRDLLAGWLAGENLADSVRLLPPLSPIQLGALYRRCSLLFHPVETTAWGSPLRLAMAYARPVVAAETPVNNALLGPAAYLAPWEDRRALGAAVITAIVEENVAEALASAARQRFATWTRHGFQARLKTVYGKVMGVE